MSVTCSLMARVLITGTSMLVVAALLAIWSQVIMMLMRMVALMALMVIDNSGDDTGDGEDNCVVALMVIDNGGDDGGNDHLRCR